MTKEDKVKFDVEGSSTVLAEFKQELETEHGGTIAQDILDKEVEAAIIAYAKAKKVKLIGPW
jgi:hypothetical protein